MARLGVNIDHVATLREVRKVDYPSVIAAADAAIRGGADGITIHLREDRRHIQDHDVLALKKSLSVPMNLEISTSVEMLDLAIKYQPEHVCLVPEKREEITTEGGLDVFSQREKTAQAIQKLQSAGMQVSLFIDPDLRQITTEYAATLLVASAAIGLLGPGEWSIDNALGLAANLDGWVGLLIVAGGAVSGLGQIATFFKPNEG